MNHAPPSCVSRMGRLQLFGGPPSRLTRFLCDWCVFDMRAGLPLRLRAPLPNLPTAAHTGRFPLHGCTLRSPVSAPTLGPAAHAEVSSLVAADTARPRPAGSLLRAYDMRVFPGAMMEPRRHAEHGSWLPVPIAGARPGDGQVNGCNGHGLLSGRGSGLGGVAGGLRWAGWCWALVQAPSQLPSPSPSSQAPFSSSPFSFFLFLLCFGSPPEAGHGLVLS